MAISKKIVDMHRGELQVESTEGKVLDEKTFEEMLPFMKQIHPGVSDETFKEMSNSCHASGGRVADG